MRTDLLAAPTLYDLHQDHHDRDDQENMNESTHGVGRDEAKQPKNDQDNCNSSEHVHPPQVSAGSNRDPVISTISTPAAAGTTIQSALPEKQAD